MHEIQIFSCEKSEWVYKIKFEINRQFNQGWCLIKFGDEAKKFIGEIIETISKEQIEKVTENSLRLKITIRELNFTDFIPIVEALVNFKVLPFSLIDKINHYFDFTFKVLRVFDSSIVVKHTIIKKHFQRSPIQFVFSLTTCNLEEKNHLEWVFIKDRKNLALKWFLPQEIFFGIPFKLIENEEKITMIITAEKDEKIEERINYFRFAVEILAVSKYLSETLKQPLLDEIKQLYPSLILPLGAVVSKQSFFKGVDPFHFLHSKSRALIETPCI